MICPVEQLICPVGTTDKNDKNHCVMLLLLQMYNSTLQIKINKASLKISGTFIDYILRACNNIIIIFMLDHIQQKLMSIVFEILGKLQYFAILGTFYPN